MRNRWIGALAALLLWPAAAGAQVSPTYTFTDGTVISSDEVNANFALLANALNRTGGTMTGTLTARDIVPSATATYDLGVTGTRFRDAWLSRNLTVAGTVDVAGVATFINTGLHILDTNASHDLIIAPGSNLTADKTLTITTGDADRTVTLSGNPTLADWFDQSVKTTATPTFATVTLSSNAGSPRLTLAGDYTGSGGSGYQWGALNVMGLIPEVNSHAAGSLNQITITEAASGTHPIFAGAWLQPPTITPGGATVANTATMYVADAPSATVSGGNYSIWVDAGAVRLDAGFQEFGRAFGAGITQAVAHAGGNFTASGSMTWTVASGDQTTFSYRLLGDTAWINLDITTSTVGGTPSTTLNIALPVTAAEQTRASCWYSDNGTLGTGFGLVGAASNSLTIFKSNGSNWTAATDTTAVSCNFALKVS